MNLDDRILQSLGVESLESYVDDKATHLVVDIKLLIADVLSEILPEEKEDLPWEGKEGEVHRLIDKSFNTCRDQVKQAAKNLGLEL